MKSSKLKILFAMAMLLIAGIMLSCKSTESVEDAGAEDETEPVSETNSVSKAKEKTADEYVIVKDYATMWDSLDKKVCVSGVEESEMIMQHMMSYQPDKTEMYFDFPGTYNQFVAYVDAIPEEGAELYDLYGTVVLVEGAGKNPKTKSHHSEVQIVVDKIVPVEAE